MYRSPFKRLRARCVGICSWARWQIGRDGARDKVGNVTSLTRFMGYSRRINSRIIAGAIRYQPIPGIFLVPPVCFQALGGCLKPTTDPETLSKDKFPASLAFGRASGLGTPTNFYPVFQLSTAGLWKTFQFVRKLFNWLLMDLAWINLSNSSLLNLVLSRFAFNPRPG